MTKPKLRLRRPTMEDAPAVCDLVIACDIEDFGAPDIDLADIIDMWSGFDLDKNVWLAERTDDDENGAAAQATLAGYAFLEEDSDEKLFSYGCVLPAARGSGVGAALVAALEARAAELHADSGAAKRLQSMVPTGDARAAALFEGRGFAPVRFFKRMALRMETAPEAPAAPNGFRIAPFVKDRDEREVYDAYTEAFADHWDFAKPPFEKWVEKTKLSGFSEQWWLLARDERDGGAVAGFALGRMRDDLLFIEQVGVRRPYRGQGLGLALLRHAFFAAYAAGQPVVSLGVDAANPSGAYRLYEKAGMKAEYEITIFEKSFGK
ncbi:MAG TPA: GNAT family N-acetyltransferase [Paenibacillus sp.]|nr:GNAT family N-acetyltransferase [Paenibacillus sp.]